MRKIVETPLGCVPQWCLIKYLEKQRAELSAAKKTAAFDTDRHETLGGKLNISIFEIFQNTIVSNDLAAF